MVQSYRKNGAKASLSSLGKGARKLARAGYRVFPCKSGGKTPLIKNWPEGATTDKKTIRRWWRKWPKANIGLLTGGPDGLLVIDIDGAEGAESFRQLEAEHGPLTVTCEVTTGRGRHLYVKMSDDGRGIRNSTGELGPGVDIRADGGYIIAPPSVHENGKRYRWANGRGVDGVDLPDIPA